MTVVLFLDEFQDVLKVDASQKIQAIIRREFSECDWGFGRHYGKDHVQVAITLHNLASAYHGLKSISAALAYGKRALRIFEAHLPADHRYVQKTRSKLEYYQFKAQLQEQASTPFEAAAGGEPAEGEAECHEPG